MNPLTVTVAALMTAILSIAGYYSIDPSQVQQSGGATVALVSFQNIIGTADYGFYAPGNTQTWAETVQSTTAAIGDPAVSYDPETQTLAWTDGTYCWYASASTDATPYAVSACPPPTSTTTTP